MARDDRPRKILSPEPDQGPLLVVAAPAPGSDAWTVRFVELSAPEDYEEALVDEPAEVAPVGEPFRAYFIGAGTPAVGDVKVGILMDGIWRFA